MRAVTIAFIIAELLTVEITVAQEAPGRRSQYEASVSWLGLTPRGNVQTNSNRVEFDSDLGIDGMQSQTGFWFLARPWDRGGLFVEFIPYGFDGEQTVTRNFRFGGVTYTVNEPVTAKASLTYLSLGYHRNIVARPRVEAGLLAGVAYFNLSARTKSPSAGPAEVDRTVPFPLAGLITRYSPSATSRFAFRGEIRGMTFGSYGGYIDFAGAVGLSLSRHAALEAGYRLIDGDGHHRTRGGTLNFQGPIIILRLFDR
jgi:hypothetical protein